VQQTTCAVMESQVGNALHSTKNPGDRSEWRK
jgi:hypothetical protein